ncbi:MAG: hypothetical protein BGO41_09945 [Clostridiales bacterium 38-18]|nr:MAG: hypothetical protein BGO41_09945 [Clostridiales bacterium 38-18]
MKENEIVDQISQLEHSPQEQINELLKVIHFDSEIVDDCEAMRFLLLGRGYLITGKSDLAISFLNRALTYFGNHYDKLAMFYCYSNIGISYREEKQYDLALRALNKCYNLAFDLDDFSYTIQTLVHIASVYSSLDNIHKAIELLDKALEYRDKLKNNKILGDLYNNYAFVLLGISEYERALEFFFLAYEVYESIYGTSFSTNGLIVIGNIGETYAMKGEYDQAMVYLKQALESAIAQNIRFVEMDCHKNLALTYEAKAMYKEALEHQKCYSFLREQVNDAQSKEAIDHLKQKLEDETKKSEEEIHILKNVELKNKTIELEKTLKNLSNIGKIGQKLTSSMDLEQIYEILRHSISNLMKVDLFGIALYIPEDDIVSFKYFEEGGLKLPLKEVDVNDTVSLAAYCIKNQTDVFIRDFVNESDYYYPQGYYMGLGNNKEQKTQSIIYTRLVSENRCIGVLTVQNYKVDAYTDSDFEVIKALATYVAIAISNAQKKNIIIEKANELEFLSYNDPLTGLLNRRSFNQRINSLINNPIFMPLGLMIGDMNYLKHINDRFGHICGDQYLIAISEVLKTHAGNSPVYRLGGDEFAIIVVNTKEEEMRRLEKKIKETCHETVLTAGSLSISLGFHIANQTSEKSEDLFSRAESAMYQEKKNYQRKEQIRIK